MKSKIFYVIQWQNLHDSSNFNLFFGISHIWPNLCRTGDYYLVKFVHFRTCIVFSLEILFQVIITTRPHNNYTN